MKKAMSVFGSLMLLSPVIFNNFNSSASANLVLTQSDIPTLLSLTSKSQGNKIVGDLIRRILGILPDQDPKRNILTFCPIFPNKDFEKLHKTTGIKPTFIWLTKPSNKVTKIVLSKKSDELGGEDQEIWTPDVMEAKPILQPQLQQNDDKQDAQNSQQNTFQLTSISYLSTLTSGEYRYQITYITEEIDQSKEVEPQPKTEEVWFEVVSEEKRQQIITTLSQIEQNNPNPNSEKIVEEKANYLLEQGFLADAIQQVFSIANPEEKKIELDKLSQGICFPTKDSPQSLTQTNYGDALDSFAPLE